MPQTQQNTKILRLKSSFNRALTLDKYKQLVHFVIVKKLKAHCPGDYVCYRFYTNCVGVATSEPDINEWLSLHDLGSRPVITKKLNTSGKVLAQARQNGFTSLGFADGIMQSSENLQDEIMRLLDSGQTLTNIANNLGCTTANIYYHRKRYKERMNKQLEVDKT